MNVVIYARFSSHNQTEQSIEGQLNACYEFAERQGYTVIGEYIDRALSGTKDTRPDFQRMINDSAKKMFEAVLVYQLDRFARNRYDSAIYKAKLKKNGVKVLSARENITDDASGVLMEAVLEGMAEYYSVELAQKVKRGMEINAKKCLYTGGNIPLGYRVDENKRFQINEDLAPIVVRIYEMYSGGSTVSEICEYLNGLRIKTSRGATFNKNSLKTILRNKKYIGYYTFRDIQIPEGIPRILTDELFYKVQDIMDKNKKAPARSKAKIEYLLTTKLFCGHCKSMMAGTSGTSKTGDVHHYYSRNGRKKKQCQKKNVQKDYIESLVIDLAREQLTDENIEKISTSIAELCEREKENPNMQRLKKLIRENEKQKGNLVDALKYGKATETLLDEISKLDNEHAELEKDIIAEKINHIDLSEDEVKFFLSQLRNGDPNDIKYRRLLITVLVNQIYLFDDHFTVIFNSSDKPVTVDKNLLDEIEEENSSFLGRLTPP